VKGLEGRLAETTARIEALQSNEQTLGLRYDEIAAQADGTERKIDALTGARDQVERLDTQVKGLEGRLAEATARIEALQRDEIALEQHQSRLVDAADASRTLAEEAAGRMTSMSALVDQLSRTSVVSDQVVEALARVQALQLESVARAESLEKGMAEFARRSDEIEHVLRAIAERDSSERTTAEIAARGGVDVQATDARAGGQQQTEMAVLQQEVQELMAAATATEEKMAADVLQSKSTITDLVEGARMNLRTASEQKEMVDQLNGRLANVQSVIQEAQTTLRALNQERELLKRIDQSIRQLREPAGKPSPGEREVV
jgi:DNA repair exonuclease SbcCD ATPase subunit